MCLAAIALNAHPRWRLVIAANRDEFHDRPAEPLALWSDGSGIIAGRDRRAGGTWLGLTAAGRLALVTNFRLPGYPQPDRPSRGALVTELLRGIEPGAGRLAALNPFNLLLLETDAAWAITNHPAPRRTRLADGLHGLSNGPFDPPWAKTTRIMSALGAWLDESPADQPEPLFMALRDTRPGPTDWPEDGPEPRLSAPFILDRDYGTRCSTVVLVDAAGQGRVIERRFGPDGGTTGETALPFHWPGRP